jgi:molybdate transport system regulatory protein
MNRLYGKIKGIESSDHISLIEVIVGNDVFSSIVLEGKQTPCSYQIQGAVTLLFKETEVGLAKNLQGMISLRNRFKSTIAHIDAADILTKVRLNYHDTTIESIISTASARAMDLRIGQEVEWLVKSNEISLMKV